MPDLPPMSTSGRFPWWVLAGSALLACLYLPSLTFRFDFIDDGCLVYRPPLAGPVELVKRTWDTTQADFRRAGPFRPISWLHWEATAALLGPCAVAHRTARLTWALLSAVSLLLLFRELRVRPGAALLAAALAMGNPYRNEIWLGLGLTEAFAMPYALLSLVCAIRAARSARPWPWDLAGFLLVLAALGCKNTFAALVPAQLFLRVTADGSSLREGWRRHGRRAGLLALTSLLPVTHFVLYRLNYQPGQYQTAFTGAQLSRMLRAVADAISLGFIGPALVAAGVAIGMKHFRVKTSAAGDYLPSPLPVWARFRPAILAGVALLTCGIGIYLPVAGRAGRYTMPAVWGADLLLAVLFCLVAEAAGQTARRITFALLGCGLLAALAVNLDSQLKYRARIELLWQALEYVERETPADAHLAWVGAWLPRMDRQELSVHEGAHFRWHLSARGRPDLAVQLIDIESGLPLPNEPTWEAGRPVYLFCGPSAPPDSGDWLLLREFRAPYRLGRRAHECQLWLQEQVSPQRLVTTTTSYRR